MTRADRYFRPIVQVGPARPPEALDLAGGWGWFTHLEVLQRDHAPHIITADVVPPDIAETLTAPRADVAGLSLDQPRVMGILNVTPDSFSDGGLNAASADAIAAGVAMREAGVDLLDVGGESTRPGAATVAAQHEIARVVPVISGLRSAGVTCPISIDTRKALVADAALAAGADLINDVSGFTHDADLGPFAAHAQVPVCVMHAQGDPATMQLAPHYDDVLLDVYDYLAVRIAALVEQGIPAARIIADPGIGFGKTQEHNLALLSRLSLFHGLGVPILLGASRKKFIGTIGQEPQADRRAPGSIGVALAALGHGVQIVRVHDVAQSIQAIALWRAAITGQTR